MSGSSATRRLGTLALGLALTAVVVPLAVRAQGPAAPTARVGGVDFNGDGWGDLAVGVPLEDLPGFENCGVVNVVYGSSAGLSAETMNIYHQVGPELEGDAEEFELFGNAVATADFNGDGFTDLAVGISNDNVGPIDSAGGVQVLYGSASGLSISGDQLWNQDSPGVLDVSESTDLFGLELAAGDFNGDGFADLAVGVPFEDVGAVSNAGAVQILYGSAAGLTASGDQFWTQDSAGIANVAEANDGFGSALVAGDFGNGPEDDLAIGVPSEGLGAVDGAGAVQVLYGSAAGLTATGNQFVTQNTPGIPNPSEPFDRFGTKLAAANFGKSRARRPGGGDPRRGHRRRQRRRRGDRGLRLRGRPDRHRQPVHPPEHRRHPGHGGAVRRLRRRARRRRLQRRRHRRPGRRGARRVDREGVRGGRGARLLRLAHRVDRRRHPVLDPGQPRPLDSAESGDNFGAAVAAANFGDPTDPDLGHVDLAIGVPGEEFAILDVGAVQVLYGSAAGLDGVGDQLLLQSAGGPEGGDRFGSDLAAR